MLELFLTGQDARDCQKSSRVGSSFQAIISLSDAPKKTLTNGNKNSFKGQRLVPFAPYEQTWYPRTQPTWRISNILPKPRACLWHHQEIHLHVIPTSLKTTFRKVHKIQLQSWSRSVSLLAWKYRGPQHVFCLHNNADSQNEVLIEKL